MFLPAFSRAYASLNEPPKKKLTKQDRARIEFEKAEAQRIQREIERQNFIQIQKQKIEREIIENEQKTIKEIAEQEIREQQLFVTCNRINNIYELDRNYLMIEREEKEWTQYLKCDGLPNPTDIKEMNTYMYLWNESLAESTIEDVTNRSNIVLSIIHELQTFIDCPLDTSQKQIEDWKTIRNDFQNMLAYHFDISCYYFLRNMESNMDLVDMRILAYTKRTENFILCMWAPRKLPEPLLNPRKVKKERLTINFTEVKTSIYFPASVDCENMVVRILWLNYDHLSHRCHTYSPPWCPKPLDLDLNEYMLIEWKKKVDIRESRKDIEARERENIEEQIIKSLENIDDETITKIISETLMDDLLEDTLQINVKKSSVNQEIVEAEDKLLNEIRRNLKKKVPQNEINLRKHTILGGVINFNLYYQPPQPKILLNRTVVTAIQLPKELIPSPFFLEYIPPPPPEAGVRRLPEEIEAELKKQEFEFDKLVLFTIDLPDTALWFEPPLVCKWDETENIWSTKHIHDVKYNEDKFTIQFRTGCFGLFGIAVNRYANIPYQTWELKPEPKGTGVIFGITAAVIICEFLVKESHVTLTLLQNGATNALQNFVGIQYKLNELINILQNGGVDIFPSFDVFNYTEGTCEKLWPMEKHLYENMAYVSSIYNFTWSRWNNLAGKRSIVMQMREYQDKRKQLPYSTLLVTPYEASLIDCTEVSQSFNSTKTHKKFCADLYNLVEGVGSINARKKLENINLRTVKTVADLLIATRTLSLA